MKTKWGLMLVAMAASAAFAQADQASTTVADQVDVAVTAYNNGRALVRDTRKLSLPTGEFALQFRDVAEQIQPETVSLRSLTAEGSVQIHEQNYEYDLISPEKLMEKYVGRDVEIRNFDNESSLVIEDATLLSNNGGHVFRMDDKIYLGLPGQVVLPEIPENLIAKPSLLWTLENTQAEQTLEATYLTGGVSWHADYVLTLAKTDQSFGLEGWVTMNNSSGASYENAKLKLVAGDVNLVTQGFGGGSFGNARLQALGYMADMAQEESFAEYHLYTMPRRTTIKNNQSKQLALLNATDAACEKVYEFRGQVHFYSSQFAPMENQHVEVFLKFQNEEENQLGMPLPGGVVRIYQEDNEGMLQFAGEDRIEHTPKDEEVRLKMGQAFDVVADRVQTDFKVVGQDVYETAFELSVRNHKESAVTVDIVEPMPADWRVLEKSQEFTKKDAHTAVFTVEVPVDGEVKVSYRVRVKY
jgi:hypothetical protein